MFIEQLRNQNHQCCTSSFPHTDVKVESIDHGASKTEVAPIYNELAEMLFGKAKSATGDSYQ